MDFKDNVYLTVARRQRMNKLVDIVNSQIVGFVQSKASKICSQYYRKQQLKERVRVSFL